MALAVIVVGCGGDDDVTTTTSPTVEEPTPAEERAEREAFIAEADRICDRFNRRYTNKPDVPLDLYYRKWESSNRALDRLDVPAEFEAEWRQYRAALDQQLRFTKLGIAREERAADRRKEEIARKIGFAVCGTG